MKKQEAAAAVIDTLAERWPNAFFADPQKRRPLKVGVHLDILEALPGVNKKTLSAALRFYTRHPLLRAGGRQGPGPRRPERRRGRAGERAGQGDGGGRVEEGGAEAGEGGRGEEGR
jgi:ProQ/FINO family